MSYPNRVQTEFCHTHHVWRAYDGRKIVAYSPDEDTLNKVTPNRFRILPHETRVKDGQRVRCTCRVC